MWFPNPPGGFGNPYQGFSNPFPLTFPVPHNFVFPTPVRVYSWDASHYKLQTPTVYSWNLTLEHQLRPDWLVRVAYVGSRTNHLNQNIQLNPAIYIPGSTLSPTPGGHFSRTPASCRQVAQGIRATIRCS